MGGTTLGVTTLGGTTLGGTTLGGTTLGGTTGDHEWDAGVRPALLQQVLGQVGHDSDSLASNLHMVWCASGHNRPGTLLRDKVARHSGHIRIPS